MKGAYIAGAMRVFYDKLGPSFFTSIYSRSVGVFEQAFFASHQPETMEGTWRKHVDGRKLINFRNIFRRKPILNLDYLVEILKDDRSYLDVGKMLSSPLNLYSFATDIKTRRPVMFDIKKENVFDLMEATCALPFLYHPVELEGKKYFDGAWAKKKYWDKMVTELYDQYDEVIVILNKNTDRQFIPANTKLRLLKPSRMPLWYAFDTNKERIVETIEQGKIDALKFIETHSL